MSASGVPAIVIVVGYFISLGPGGKVVQIK